MLPQVFVAPLFIFILGALPSDAGYYKGRPPPPKLHYGPKPPAHYLHKPPSFHSHHRRPPPIGLRQPIRPPPPPRPFIVKPTPPPFPPASWKTRFSAPVVKEPFHSPQLDYSPQNYVRDDDKGPIHTIPAPNLSPADRPAHANQASDLEAVLKHGQNLHSKPTHSQQVTEDPSTYKPYSGSPSYFAPDPDPSLPTVEVTQTLDPQSQPSNGQVPLDLYHQQVEAQQQTDHQQSYNEGNSLSSQDLFNLLHGVGESQQQMTAALYQQYLQAATGQQPAAYQQVYNAGLLYPQQYQQQLAHQFSQQNFHPQFETFNYNEQTQESAHGSDSFPSASSLSVGVKRAVSKDTGISGESANAITNDQKGFFEDGQQEVSSEVGVISNQVDYEDYKSTEKSEAASNILTDGFYSALPNKQAADTLATLAAAGNINNQMMKRPNLEKQETKQQSTNKEYQSLNDGKNIKQHSVVYEMNFTRNNEVRGQETNNNEQAQTFNKQGNQNGHREQSFSPEKEDDNEEDNSYRNHNMGGQLNNYDNKVQQSFQVQNTRGQIDNSGQTYSESDYNEDEILEPSDKDQMSNTMYAKNGMRVYGAAYYNNDEKDEERTEEHSYEDSESDYTQEEESDINKAALKSSSTVDKTVNYNSHQNKLPFGAKLRPKRV